MQENVQAGLVTKSFVHACSQRPESYNGIGVLLYIKYLELLGLFRVQLAANLKLDLGAKTNLLQLVLLCL